MRLKFNKGCLKQQNKLVYDYGHRVIVYIVYEFGTSSSSSSDPTLKNCLFGGATLIIGFERKSSFTFPGGGFGQNVLIFGVDISSFAHINNEKKDILVLVKGPTQG